MSCSWFIVCCVLAPNFSLFHNPLPSNKPLQLYSPLSIIAHSIDTTACMTLCGMLPSSTLQSTLYTKRKENLPKHLLPRMRFSTINDQRTISYGEKKQGKELLSGHAESSRKRKKDKVPPRFELGLSDSESEVLTVTPRNLDDQLCIFMHI